MGNIKSRYFDNRLDDWGYEDPTNEFHFIEQMLGKPDYIDTSEGGYAQWSSSLSRHPLGKVLTSVEVIDENKYHKYPTPHDDFVYCTVDIGDVKLNLTNLTNIDIKPPNLTACCNSIPRCVSLLVFATDFILGKISPNEVKGPDFINKYLRPNNGSVLNKVDDEIDKLFKNKSRKNRSMFAMKHNFGHFVKMLNELNANLVAIRKKGMPVKQEDYNMNMKMAYMTPTNAIASSFFGAESFQYPRYSGVPPNVLQTSLNELMYNERFMGDKNGPLMPSSMTASMHAPTSSYSVAESMRPCGCGSVCKCGNNCRCVGVCSCGRVEKPAFLSMTNIDRFQAAEQEMYRFS